MLHAHFTALCVIDAEIFAMEFSHCGIWICAGTQVSVARILNGCHLFCSRDPDLDRMTFIYDPDPYSLEMHGMCNYELPVSRLAKVIV